MAVDLDELETECRRLIAHAAKFRNYIPRITVDALVLDDLITELRALRASAAEGASRTPVEAGVVTRERFACAFCGKPATCFGSYEGRNSDFACDDCCGHGCEDGDCVAVEREGYSAEARGASRAPAEAGVVTDSVNQAWFRYQLESIGKDDTQRDMFVAGYLSGHRDRGAARTPLAETGACLADMPFERDGEIVGADICRLPRGHQGQHQTQLLPRASACPPAEQDTEKREAAWNRYVATKHATRRDTERDAFAFAYQAGVADGAATPPAELTPLPDDIANLRRYLDDSETTAFPVPRSVWEALERVAAAVAPPQEPPARAVVGQWQPFHFDDSTPIREGQFCLFYASKGDGIQVFADSIVWDAETDAQWGDGSHGWEIDDVSHWMPLPPAASTGRGARVMSKPAASSYPTCCVCFRKRSKAERSNHATLCAKCAVRLLDAPPERDGMNPDSADYWDEP